MSNIKQAHDVLVKAQEQIISELAICGQSGGVGRAPNFAQVLANIVISLEFLEKKLAVEDTENNKNAEWKAKMVAAQQAKKEAKAKE
jgi:hypothetical protein